MKSQIQFKPNKIILVLSDLHLGAGEYVNGIVNDLEDFHNDYELVEFFDFYSKGKFEKLDIELIINGDFFDFLAVPYVDYFDDEFWSEKASLEKLKIILDAHRQVIMALDRFLQNENHKVVYIFGNHDAEMIFDSCKMYFHSMLSEKSQENIRFLVEEDYIPIEGVVVKHGHDYERPHDYSLKNNLIEPVTGEKYFLPPWGSYYVARVINKYKVERRHINMVRPIKSFLMHGLLFDTFFTVRFMIANAYFFIRVIAFEYFKILGSFSWRKLLKNLFNELEIFKDYEHLTKEYFVDNPDVRVLLVGHTHLPIFRNMSNNSYLINTGTWTQMYDLDFARRMSGHLLTYGIIECQIKEDPEKDSRKVALRPQLLVWEGTNRLPFKFFT